METDNEVMEGEGNILIADDEDVVLDIGVEMLENLGYTVFANCKRQRSGSYLRKGKA